MFIGQCRNLQFGAPKVIPGARGLGEPERLPKSPDVRRGLTSRSTFTDKAGRHVCEAQRKGEAQISSAAIKSKGWFFKKKKSKISVGGGGWGANGQIPHDGVSREIRIRKRSRRLSNEKD